MLPETTPILNGAVGFRQGGPSTGCSRVHGLGSPAGMTPGSLGPATPISGPPAGRPAAARVRDGRAADLVGWLPGTAGTAMAGASRRRLPPAKAVPGPALSPCGDLTPARKIRANGGYEPDASG